MTEPCATCNPPVEAPGPRLGEHHVGIRFGDGGTGLTILLDGQDITSDTREAWAGHDGWAIVMPRNPEGRRYRCPHAADPAHVATVLRRGHVTIHRNRTVIVERADDPRLPAEPTDAERAAGNDLQAWLDKRDR